ncbi:MAG TPA: hypothetical protein VK838_03665 [Candidatus Limnocylindrales bacterium]|nr:hypothetical protein [Candidatus Limnocylindrales bacterium]
MPASTDCSGVAAGDCAGTLGVGGNDRVGVTLAGGVVVAAGVGRGVCVGGGGVVGVGAGVGIGVGVGVGDGDAIGLDPGETTTCGPFRIGSFPWAVVAAKTTLWVPAGSWPVPEYVPSAGVPLITDSGTVTPPALADTLLGVVPT